MAPKYIYINYSKMTKMIVQELYIRKNCIPDISEVCYLRDLPRLKNLWLEENPCCAGGDADLYRWTVIRCAVIGGEVVT